MNSFGQCACCSERAALDRGICAGCVRRYGANAARVLVRCESDPNYASACFAALGPEAGRRLAEVLTRRCLAGAARPLAHTRGIRHVERVYFSA